MRCGPRPDRVRARQGPGETQGMARGQALQCGSNNAGGFSVVLVVPGKAGGEQAGVRTKPSGLSHLGPADITAAATAPTAPLMAMAVLGETCSAIAPAAIIAVPWPRLMAACATPNTWLR